MYISELEAGETITIEATDDQKTIRMASPLIEISGEDQAYLQAAAASAKFHHFTVIEVIKEGEFAVNFQSAHVRSKATALKGTKAYTWDKVQIVRLRLPSGKVVQAILCNTDAQSFNRRQEYRLPLHSEATIQVNEDGELKKALLKDLSEHGIGFTVADEVELNINDKIDIQFKDTEAQGSPSFHVIGRVLRVYPTNNKRLDVGCMLTAAPDDLGKYINETQRSRLKLS